MSKTYMDLGSRSLYIHCDFLYSVNTFSVILYCPLKSTVASGLYFLKYIFRFICFIFCTWAFCLHVHMTHMCLGQLRWYRLCMLLYWFYGVWVTTWVLETEVGSSTTVTNAFEQWTMLIEVSVLPGPVAIQFQRNLNY